MHRLTQSSALGLLALLSAALLLLALPGLSSADPTGDVVKKLVDDVDKAVEKTTGIKLTPDEPSPQGGSPERREPGNGAGEKDAQSAGNNIDEPGGLQPPLHGDNPHGQGTASTVDLAPTAERPVSGETAEPETIVVGRSEGEQTEGGEDGRYRGHVTVAALAGNELIGVDTEEGEQSDGPAGGLNDALNGICDSSSNSICLNAVEISSETDGRGSRNSFRAVGARIGPPATALIDASVISSQGNISENDNSQTARGQSDVADAGLLAGGLNADAISATSESTASNNGGRTVDNTGNVVNLNTAGLPVPAPGCADGTPDSEFNLVLIQAVCNADDTDGEGEDTRQARSPYGVRQGLNVTALPAAGTALARVVTANGESQAVAPGRDGGNGGGGNGDGGDDRGDRDRGDRNRGDRNRGDRNRNRNRGNGRGIRGPSGPACDDRLDNDGDGLVDFPPDPGCSSANDDSELDGGADLIGVAGTGDGGAAAKPECDDGRDNDGDGETDFPDDPECSSAADDSESEGTLASTGLDLGLLALIGALALIAGLSLRTTVGRLSRPARVA